MSLVRGGPVVALVAMAACVGHAKHLAGGATRGVKAEVARIDPAVARTVGAQAGRGVVTGAVSELANGPELDVINGLVNTTVDRAVDRAVARVVAGLGRSLAEDPALRKELAAITHEASASAVYGARDALADVFPRCAGAADRRRCIEDEVSGMARAAARGMMAGFVGSSGGWPLLLFMFLAGVLLTLLFVAVRTHVPEHRRHQRA